MRAFMKDLPAGVQCAPCPFGNFTRLVLVMPYDVRCEVIRALLHELSLCTPSSSPEDDVMLAPVPVYLQVCLLPQSTPFTGVLFTEQSNSTTAPSPEFCLTLSISGGGGGGRFGDYPNSVPTGGAALPG